MSLNENALQLHRDLDFIGLRAQATSVGLLQLCAELAKAGVIDSLAMERIKDAIHSELVVTNSNVRNRDEFEDLLRKRLDKIFPQAEDGERGGPVGTLQDMQAALKP